MLKLLNNMILLIYDCVIIERFLFHIFFVLRSSYFKSLTLSNDGIGHYFLLLYSSHFYTIEIDTGGENIFFGLQNFQSYIFTADERLLQDARQTVMVSFVYSEKGGEMFFVIFSLVSLIISKKRKVFCRQFNKV